MRRSEPETRPAETRGGPAAPSGRTEPDPSGRVELAAFNALPAGQARDLLLTCCRAPRWADALVAARPYPSLRALLSRAGAALTDDDVRAALAGHPRIGAASGGGPDASSPREQAGLAGASGEVLAELASGNREYERRFGHIYLVRAAGRSAPELLRILRDRLTNDPDTEWAVVRAELRDINERRLAEMITS